MTYERERKRAKERERERQRERDREKERGTERERNREGWREERVKEMALYFLHVHKKCHFLVKYFSFSQFRQGCKNSCKIMPAKV